MTEQIQGAQPAHTPGPWAARAFPAYGYGITAGDSPQARESFAVVHFADTSRGRTAERAKADARLIAAAPELLAACINARDILATDRQAFVDCQRLRDRRTEDPIAHGLVAVEDDVWLDAADAEALRDYDRAIEQIDKATANATGAQP